MSAVLLFVFQYSPNFVLPLTHAQHVISICKWFGARQCIYIVKSHTDRQTFNFEPCSYYKICLSLPKEQFYNTYPELRDTLYAYFISMNLKKLLCTDTLILVRNKLSYYEIVGLS